MTQTTAEAGERDSLGFAGAAIFNFVFMLFINAHEAWRPWLDGIVTESFKDVLWAVNLGFVLQIFGNLILSVSSPRPLRGLTELVCSVGALAGAVVFYRVFPLEQVPEMTRGVGVILQKGGLADAKTFVYKQGLTFVSAGKERTETALTAWRGERAQAGMLPPNGFPKSKKFSGV